MKITKYLFLFVMISLFFSGIFACHIYTTEAADFVYNLSDPCPDEEEISISQNKIPNGQEFMLGFPSIASEKLFNLISEPGINTNFIFLENLNNSQTSQLLTITKIE